MGSDWEPVEPVDLSFYAWLILKDFEASAVYEMKNGSPKLYQKLIKAIRSKQQLLKGPLSMGRFNIWEDSAYI